MEINDEKASQIFAKLKSKNTVLKKMWSDQEFALLMWATNQYSDRKQMKVKDFLEEDWIQISGFLPGRTDFQCRYRYYQKKSE